MDESCSVSHGHNQETSLAPLIVDPVYDAQKNQSNNTIQAHLTWNKMSVNNNSENYTRLRKKRPKVLAISARRERNLSIKKVSVILQKEESTRTKEEKELLFNYSEIVKEAALRIERRRKIKERLKEVEDSEAVLDAKCKQLAEAVLKSQYLVVYTGAGISTAARIPDYRGASGIWTLLQQGKDIGPHDLTQADPTYTHMALFQLYLQGKLKHIVSQNCDGLHLRSGMPKRALSEVHGNMYIEVCRTCRPIIEYLRLFDVTENTARYNHKTMRKCYKCNSSLVDSIVHFGERGNLPWPLNWKGACKAAEKADMILCIGSSLKVLKRYPWLWCMDKPIKRRPLIYIVNLQWTPKDCHAAVKINGKCDIVMEKLMKYLAITVPEYSRKVDPIFEHATDLCKAERHTTNRPFLTTAAEPRETDKIKTENFSVENKVKDNHIKKEEPTFDLAIVQKKIKNEFQESCVTSCKKEVIIDTGQGDNMKCIKQELIVITIRSGDDFKDCCDLFRINQSHECDCPNFIDTQYDIPVIIQDDFLFLKDGVESPIKVEKSDIFSDNEVAAQNMGKAIISNDTIKKLDESNEEDSKSKFAQELINSPNSFCDENGTNFYCSKRVNCTENSDNHSKKQKICEDSDTKSESKGTLSFSSESSSVLETHFSKTKNVNSSEDNSRHKGQESTTCSFCSKQYLSNSCLFYTKRDPIFQGNVPTCDCCSDEDDDAGSETSEDKLNDLQKAVINPGWYGKGFRKSIRKKR